MIASYIARVISNWLPLLLAALGFAAGIVVAGVVASYRRARRFWPWLPWPPGRGPRLGRMLPAPLVVAATFYGLALQYGRAPALLAVGAVESALLIALFFIDLDLRLIPTLPVGALALLALSSATMWPDLGLGSTLLGGAVGFAGFSVLKWLGHLVFGEEVLGAGDANLALAIGCMTGYPLVAATLALGIIVGGLVAGVVLVLRRGGLRSAMPYGPAVIAAALVVLVHGNTTRPFP